MKTYSKAPGKSGTLNHICDVKGISVGHSQIIDSSLSKSKGPGICTGVSVVFPQAKNSKHFRVPAGVHVFQGNGELTGLAHIQEYGILEGPIGLTSTFSVGTVSQALRKWMRKEYTHNHDHIFMGLPVVAETYDGYLHNVDSDALKEEHVFEALKNATPKNTQRGTVGGGSGMMSFGLKSGIGSSSRIIEINKKKYTLGVLVQSNFGKREDLILNSKAFGLENISAKLPNFLKKKDGSLVGIIATDLALSPLQLNRLAKRASLGMALTGGKGRNSSGDFFIAFSTQAPKTLSSGFEEWILPKDSDLDAIYEATVWATHDAILDSLWSSQAMQSGKNKIYSIHDLF